MKSLQRNELRPFEYFNNKHVRNEPRNLGNNQNTRILSASPIRATMKIDQGSSSSDLERVSDDEEIIKERRKTLLSNYAKEKRKSPIKDDS